MQAEHFIHGVALVAVSVGGLLIVIGRSAEGKRALGFGIALIVAAPLALAGLAEIRAAAVRHDETIERLLLALFLAAVVLAGVVALRRSGRGKPGTDATSQKKRIERAP